MKLIEKIIESNPDFYDLENYEVIDEFRKISSSEDIVFDTLALVFMATPFYSFRNYDCDYERQIEYFFNQEVD